MAKIKKILIIGCLDGVANSVRPIEIQKYLKRHSFEVSIFDTYSPLFEKAKYNYYSIWKKKIGKARRNYFRQFPLLASMAITAEVLSFIVNQNRYDAVICETLHAGYLFLKGLNCLKILDLPTPWSPEWATGYKMYKEGLADKTDALYKAYTHLNEEYLEEMKKTELEIYKSSDYISFHWHSYTEYEKKYVYNSKKMFILDWGCCPKCKRAKWSSKIKIINIGYLGDYWVNKSLLSYLTRLRTYPIHCYGIPRPQKRYGLAYKGYLKDSEFHKIIPSYQFGLVTITKDKIRRYGFSSKSLEYISWGLPVLMPEWRCSSPAEGHIFYNENNFSRTVRHWSMRENWQTKSDEAYGYAQEHTWDKQLKPLLKILKN